MENDEESFNKAQEKKPSKPKKKMVEVRYEVYDSCTPLEGLRCWANEHGLEYDDIKFTLYTDYDYSYLHAEAYFSAKVLESDENFARSMEVYDRACKKYVKWCN